MNDNANQPKKEQGDNTNGVTTSGVLYLVLAQEGPHAYPALGYHPTAQFFWLQRLRTSPFACPRPPRLTFCRPSRSWQPHRQTHSWNRSQYLHFSPFHPSALVTRLTIDVSGLVNRWPSRLKVRSPGHLNPYELFRIAFFIVPLCTLWCRILGLHHAFHVALLLIM